MFFYKLKLRKIFFQKEMNCERFYRKMKLRKSFYSFAKDFNFRKMKLRKINFSQNELNLAVHVTELLLSRVRSRLGSLMRAS